jgi:periplasmic divalent cation tolerance protein
MEALIVVTNLPDEASARALAEHLVNEKLAACVNILAGCTSVYRWKGEVQRDPEVPVLIKTRKALYPAVEAAIRERHPYELPEVVAVQISDGSPAYLEWLSAETRA